MAGSKILQPFEEMVFTKEGAMESKKIDLMFAFQKFLDEHFFYHQQAYMLEHVS